MFLTKSVEKNHNTRFTCNNLFSKIVPFMRKRGKILQNRKGHRWQRGAWASNVG